MEKQYLDLSGAGKFLSKLKEMFSSKSHKHIISDIIDMIEVKKEVISDETPDMASSDTLKDGDYWIQRLK